MSHIPWEDMPLLPSSPHVSSPPTDFLLIIYLSSKHTQSISWTHTQSHHPNLTIEQHSCNTNSSDLWHGAVTKLPWPRCKWKPSVKVSARICLQVENGNHRFALPDNCGQAIPVALYLWLFDSCRFATVIISISSYSSDTIIVLTLYVNVALGSEIYPWNIKWSIDFNSKICYQDI